jgi:hypothetical protein
MSKRTRSNPAGNPDAAHNAKSGDAGSVVIEGGNSGTENSNSKLADASAGWTTDTITNPASDTIANAYTDTVSAFGPTDASADTGTVSTSDTVARKRGRPRGSTNASTKAAPGDITGIEKLLLSCHKMLAASMPEWDMESDEAHQISVAYNDVANYYPIMRLPGNVSALVTFAGVVGVSYGSRIAATRFRVMAERGHRPQPRNVTPTRQQNSQPMPANEMPIPPQSDPQVNGVDYNAMNNRPDVPQDLRTANIPGVGPVEFPADHPLVSGKRH